MSMEFTHAAWRYRPITANPLAEKLLVLALADVASEMGQGYPSPSFLVQRCGIPIEMVMFTLERLAAAGVLSISPTPERIYFTLNFQNLK